MVEKLRCYCCLGSLRLLHNQLDLSKLFLTLVLSGWVVFFPALLSELFLVCEACLPKLPVNQRMHAIRADPEQAPWLL